MWTLWILPLLIVLTTVGLSIPVGLYLAWIMDGRYRAPAFLRWFEERLNTGRQSWKQYAVALLLFNTVMFVFGFLVLALQPYLPFAPEGKGMLGPTTIFNSVTSFLTNTNLQHYSGEQHLSYFSQVFFVLWNMFVSASVGFCALVAIIRGLRGDAHMGNFYQDMWRAVVYVFLPSSLLMGVILMADGVPMTLAPTAQVSTAEKGAMGKDQAGKDKPQEIARGPVAAVIPIKHLGTNGGGFFGANSAHPFENPTGWSNFLTCVNILIFPFSLVVMFGRMLGNLRHAAVIYGVMMALFLVMIGWAVSWDTLQPNPGLTARAAEVQPLDQVPQEGGPPKDVWMVAPPGAPPQLVDRDPAKGGADKPQAALFAGLPVDQELGNLEGKELRFGTSAGATYSAVTTAVTCGSVNCMHDSLNPLAGLTPFTGMWLNCVFGGKGVGIVNLLLYLIVGVFLAGLMVGRTPEYLGKKVEAREMKLAMLALLVHPILVLGGTGLFASRSWGIKAENNPAAHGFSEVLYEFSSASANNGSGFEGLGDTWGFNVPDQNNSPPAPYSPYWDIATGLVMLLGRFLPIVAPIALAGSLATKKMTPYTVGTLRTDTVTFGFVLLGTILLVGALLFLPAAVLGPVAEHLGPIPFGG
jgi:K+-transporting ATPase ATPase A chain